MEYNNIIKMSSYFFSVKDHHLFQPYLWHEVNVNKMSNMTVIVF